MSSETGDIAIAARDLGKVYRVYKRPQDRLKQMFFRKRRYFEEYWAVSGVDLTIRRGEAVGLIGRNGSGKSTLLQMIAGTLQPSAGSVEARGRVAALLELGAGFNPEFTGRENVALSASVLGLSEQEIRARFDSIAAFAGIGDFIDQPVKSYSSGMYARLAFAVAAHVDADILIVDEILAVGDAAFAQKCMRFIRGFREKGTLLFVSHDTGAVLNLCDRAVWLHEGRVREVGPAREVCLDYHAAIAREADEENEAFRIGGRRSMRGPAGDAPLPQDVRREALDPALREAIEVFAFDPNAAWHGHLGARIERVELLDAQGAPAQAITGGEDVALRVCGRAQEALLNPIVGFFVRDRLGQDLFGDNTYLTYRDAPAPLSPGEPFEAEFHFRLPYLPTGDYAIVAAIADGTQSAYVPHHWLDEALIFRVHSSHVARGLVGIPMTRILLRAGSSGT